MARHAVSAYAPRMRSRYRPRHRIPWWSEDFKGDPRWFSLALVVLVVLAVPLILIARAGQSLPTDVRAAGFVESNRVKVSVVGDSYTSGSFNDPGATRTWPELVAADGYATFQVLAIDGTGYATYNPHVPYDTFVTRASDVDPEADIVIFFGSRFDVNQGSVVRHAALNAFAETRALAPDSILIVVGPLWPTAEPPIKIIEDRGALASAAAANAAIFVDPIAERWFVDDPGLIDSDGLYATQRGQEYLATKLSAVIRDAVEAR